LENEHVVFVVAAAVTTSSSSTVVLAALEAASKDSSLMNQTRAEIVTLPISQPKLKPPLPLSNSSILSSSSSPDRTKNKVGEWPWPHIHTVRTFFMQNQGNLTTLARARIELFKTFCLPTMKAQTSQQFLWLIRTDPGLDASIMKEMVDLLKDNPNFYLLGSNNQGHAFDGMDLDKIYTGNLTLLKTAMGLKRQLPALETRLDADDGLHLDFFRDIQRRALQSLPNDNLKWMCYCFQNFLGWRMYKKDSYGSLMQEKEPFCISPGITVARAAGVRKSAVPKSNHYRLMNTVRKLSQDKSCGYNETSRCLVVLGTESSGGDGGVNIIRSRTSTSAGMMGVVVSQKKLSKEAGILMAMLKILQDDFHIPRDGLKWLNNYMQEHVAEIAKENLQGQCTKGRSCKVRL
jgi:hypothetical protein